MNTDGGSVQNRCYSNGVKSVDKTSGTSRTTQQFKNGALCYTTRVVQGDGGGTSYFAIENPAGLTVGSFIYSQTDGHPYLTCEGQSYDVDACVPKTVFSCTVGTCQ